jgi:formiminotetrahydrofolate cyclodeaminase
MTGSADGRASRAEVLARIIDSRDNEVGGGASAALVAAMAAGLAGMVARLSVAHDLALPAARYEELAEAADALAEELSRGAADDVAAYARLKAAFGLPKDTDAAKEARAAAIEDGLRYAAAVPLENARRADRVADICAELADRSNPAAATDLAVGVALAEDGLEGCLLNVKVNTETMRDDQAVAALLEEVAALRESQTRRRSGYSGG